MTHYQNSKELAQLSLGKATGYSTRYNPDLLQAVPRSLNRDSLHITAATLPFLGEDVWYGYELSWLNAKGKPVVAVAEFRFECTSPNIVESKSFKLYLNSLNQTVFNCHQDVKDTLIRDLSTCSGSPVKVTLFKVDDCPALELTQLSANCIDELDVEITHYDYQKNLLTEGKSTKIRSTDKTFIEESLVSHLLKSNCLITNQPDWASVYITYKGEQISHSALLKYLISFRQHNEFHEQCVERIFCDLQEHYQLQQLTVFARYTRRGGLDINPFRSTHLINAPDARTLRQ